jgi:hypothetical protein
MEKPKELLSEPWLQSNRGDFLIQERPTHTSRTGANRGRTWLMVRPTHKVERVLGLRGFLAEPVSVSRL